MRELTHLSLFSGIGGLDLAVEWAGFRTVGQCEWADYPTKVLEKHWPDVTRWRDIRTLTGESFYERTGLRTVDIISGGFPCQPFSVAGKQRGKEDDRYLWPEMVRVIKELRPAWVVGENVAGIVRMALPDILSELGGLGYRTRAFLIPACAVGARHRRYRVAIVAYTKGKQDRWIQQSGIRANVGASSKDVQHTDCTGCEEQYIAREPDKQGFPRGGCNEGNVSDTNDRSGALRGDRKFSTVEETGSGWRDIGRRTPEHEPGERRPTESRLGGVAYGLACWLDGDIDFLLNHYWDTEPDIPRIATGILNRVKRLKALGNAVVPQQFYPIFNAIAAIESMQEELDGK